MLLRVVVSVRSAVEVVRPKDMMSEKLIKNGILPDLGIHQQNVLKLVTFPAFSTISQVKKSQVRRSQPDFRLIKVDISCSECVKRFMLQLWSCDTVPRPY